MHLSATNLSKSVTVLNKDVDLLLFTETWLADDDTVIIGELTPPGDSFIMFHRRMALVVPCIIHILISVLSMNP